MLPELLSVFSFFVVLSDFQHPQCLNCDITQRILVSIASKSVMQCHIRRSLSLFLLGINTQKLTHKKTYFYCVNNLTCDMKLNVIQIQLIHHYKNTIHILDSRMQYFVHHYLLSYSCGCKKVCSFFHMHTRMTL